MIYASWIRSDLNNDAHFVANWTSRSFDEGCTSNSILSQQF